MGRNKAVSLCVALVFGSVFAVAVSNWEEQSAGPLAKGRRNVIQQVTAESPASREPEFLAESIRGSSSPILPAERSQTGQPDIASYEGPESSTAAIGQPDLMPAPPPAELAPAEMEPDQPAPAADGPPAADATPAAESTPAEGAPTEETPATDQPATDDEAAQSAPPAEPDSPTLAWHDDYGQAMDAAIEQQRMLLIFFFDPNRPDAQSSFEQQSLADPKTRESVARDYVAAKLPTTAVISQGGKSVQLLKHPAFAEMLGRPGVAILDFAHPGAEYFGRVVSTFPFITGRYYSRPVLSTVLNLPPGTLTQRTMIYAVRIHPEAPASTQGQFHGVLADEANRHSIHQAAILVQGHHNWDSRVQRISTRLSSVSGARSRGRELAIGKPGRGLHRLRRQLAALARPLGSSPHAAPAVWVRHPARSQRHLVRDRNLRPPLAPASGARRDRIAAQFQPQTTSERTEQHRNKRSKPQKDEDGGPQSADGYLGQPTVHQSKAG